MSVEPRDWARWQCTLQLEGPEGLCPAEPAPVPHARGSGEGAGQQGELTRQHGPRSRGAMGKPSPMAAEKDQPLKPAPSSLQEAVIGAAAS